MNRAAVMVGLLLLACGGAAWWLLRPPTTPVTQATESPTAPPAAPSVAADTWQAPAAPTEAVAPAPKPTQAPTPPSGIYYWECRSSGQATPIEQVDMRKPAEQALHAMQICFEVGYQADPREDAYSLSFIFYLEDDGSVRDTGILSDTNAEATFEASQDCAWDYWRRNRPVVPPTAEPDFICEYWWKLDSVPVPSGPKAPPKSSGIKAGEQL